MLRNTFEEAEHVRSFLRPLPSDLGPLTSDFRPQTSDLRSSPRPRILLVTSAYHLRRAEAVFRKAGMDVIPVACDFVAGLAELESKPLFNPIPRPGGFDKMQLYMHEVIGWWVYRWRGWVGKGEGK